MKLSFLPLPKRKIPAVIGMAFSVVSLGFFIAAAICFVGETPPAPDEVGTPTSFNWWIQSLPIAMVGLIFYLVDAVICVVRACQRRGAIFHVIMAVIILIGVAVFLFYIVAIQKNLLCMNSLVVIWNLYLLAMVVLEAVSIVKFT